MEMRCAECGCLVDQGLRLAECKDANVAVGAYRWEEVLLAGRDPSLRTPTGSTQASLEGVDRSTKGSDTIGTGGLATSSQPLGTRI
jgi:hypothetical protein